MISYVNCRNAYLLAGIALCLLCNAASANSETGNDELNNTLSFTSGFYTNEPLFGEDRPQISTLSLVSEVFLDLSDRFSLTMQPYLQYEHLSNENTHTDLRKFLFRYTADRWEFRAGIDQVFWGVAESRHLVDTINQSDFAADFTGDTKLGQPLLSFTRFSNYGDFSFFYLPRFREPAYASADSRPRLPFSINENLNNYESPDKNKSGAYALRWSGAFNVFDVGLHAFSGTRRQPQISNTERGFASRFLTVNQFGLDAQATIDALLIKLEWIQQSGDEIQNHSEVVSGLEYTLSQVLGSQTDLGLIIEALYDSRQDLANHLFQKDLMAGARLAFNDANSTELLISLIADLDNAGKVIQFEFDRRIGPNFTVGLNGQWWRDTEDDATLSTLSTENNVRFQINWYF